MKNKTMLSTIICAAKGLFLAIRTEKNFGFYFVNILLTLPINFLLHFSSTEHLVYTICAAGVFSAECVNTAVERLCDYLTESYDKKIQAVKDICAGAVLCWGIAFYTAEIIMLGGKLLG